MLLSEHEKSMYKVVRLNYDEEEAWKLYCLETKGSMSAADFWHELPFYIQNNYLKKIKTPDSEKLSYEFISQAMLDSITKQKEGGEERFILAEFDPKQLEIIKRFIFSFILREEEALHEFAKKHEELLDNHWKKEIGKLLK